MITKDTYKEIQGWLSDREATALQQVARELTILEIGTWKGKSAIAMAATATSVVTVDNFFGDDFTGKAFTLPEAVENFRKYDNEQKITLVIKDFKELVKSRFLFSAVYNVSLVYYDADHTREAVISFTQLLDKFGQYGKLPIIAFHDYEFSPVYQEGVSEFKNYFDKFLKDSYRLVIVDRLALAIPDWRLKEFPELLTD